MDSSRAARRLTHLVSITLTLALVDCSWCPPRMDSQIRDLQSQLVGGESALGKEAQTYFVDPPEDFYIEVTAEPLTDVFRELEKKTPLTLTIRSTSHSGHIWSKFKDCPWPFPGDIGLWVDPDVLVGAIVITDIKSDWSSAGLKFRLTAAGTGALLVTGGYETCGWSAPIVAGAGVVVVAAINAGGRAKFSPSNDGLRYAIKMTDLILGYGSVVGLFSAPFLLEPKFGGGTIKNIVGKKGKIQITETGELKCFSLDFVFKNLKNLPAGPAASGGIETHWVDPDRETKKCPK